MIGTYAQNPTTIAMTVLTVGYSINVINSLRKRWRIRRDLDNGDIRDDTGLVRKVFEAASLRDSYRLMFAEHLPFFGKIIEKPEIYLGLKLTSLGDRENELEVSFYYAKNKKGSYKYPLTGREIVQMYPGSGKLRQDLQTLIDLDLGHKITAPEITEPEMQHKKAA